MRQRDRERRRRLRSERRAIIPNRRYFASESSTRRYRTDFWACVAVCNCPGNEISRLECWHIKEVLNVNEESSTALTVAEPTAVATLPIVPPRGLITKPELAIIASIAQTVGGESTMMPKWIKTPGQATAIMLAGHELGLQPMAAVRHLYVVNGAVVASAQALASLVLANEPGADIVILETTAEKATVELRRPGRQPLQITYTIEDAKRAKLTGKDNWSLYPADMLRWRAISRVCRLGAGDLTNAVRPLNFPAPAELDSSDMEPLEVTTVAELPEAHEDAGAAEGPPDPREAFAEWCIAQNMTKTGTVEKRLGIPATGKDPVGMRWVDPLNAVGYTTDEALDLAREALTAVIAEATKLHAAKESEPWAKAIETVGPLGYRDRAIAERTAKEPPDDGEQAEMSPQ